MSKTKVWLSPSLLEYQREMAELVDRVCQETACLRGLDRLETQELLCPRVEVLELCLPGLLAHPRVEMIWADIALEDGHLEGLIQIHTSEYYGVMNVYMTLVDEQGNPIESDFAMHNDFVRNHWSYIPSAPLASGRTVVIRAVAMDCLGGVGVHTEHVTV